MCAVKTVTCGVTQSITGVLQECYSEDKKEVVLQEGYRCMVKFYSGVTVGHKDVTPILQGGLQWCYSVVLVI
jgi:hypothetical protein